MSAIPSMTATTSMPIHDPDDPSKPLAPRLGLKVKTKKEKIEANMQRRIKAAKFVGSRTAR